MKTARKRLVAETEAEMIGDTPKLIKLLEERIDAASDASLEDLRQLQHRYYAVLRRKTRERGAA